MSEKKQIVILGAGYAGLAAAMLLESNKAAARRADVLMVDRHPYHLIKTELHAVAAGQLRPSQAALPLNLLLAKTEIDTMTADVTRMDTDAGRIFAGEEEISFDVLVLAPGGVNHTFGIPGMDKHGLPLKTLDDALEIRARLRDIIRASRASGGGRADILVVGAGATGVESAAYIMDRIRREHLPASTRPRVSLIEGADLILPGGSYTRSVRRKARRRLERNGVRVQTGARVKKVASGKLHLAGGDVRDFDLLIWAGGLITDADLMGPLPAETGPGARVEVSPEMNLPNQPNVYVLGDAALVRFGAARKPLPCAAQYALQQAEVAAHNIAVYVTGRGRTKEYTPNRQGEFVSIGREQAVAWAGPVEFLGHDAQLMKKAILGRYLNSIGVDPARWFMK